MVCFMSADVLVEKLGSLLSRLFWNNYCTLHKSYCVKFDKQIVVKKDIIELAFLLDVGIILRAFVSLTVHFVH